MTPQGRATKWLEEKGFLVDVVERIQKRGNVTWRNDLWGAWDLLGIHADGTVCAVQVTSRSNVSARVKKLAELEVLDRLRTAGWQLLVMGWGRTVKSGDWKIVDIS